MKGSLSNRQQTIRVAYLGFTFMIMFTAFNSLQNIVSKLYDQYGYINLGQTSVLFIYLAFSISTFFTSFIIKNFGYKRVMFVCALGYAIFQTTGLIIGLDLQIPNIAAWIMVIAGAIICGISASALWVAQGAYTGQVAGEQRKAALFGLFWALMMSSQILGNLLTTFVLGLLSNFQYFLILTIIGYASAFLFLFLPNVSKAEVEVTEKVSIKDEFNKIKSIVFDSKYRYLKIYFLFPGVTVAFYAAYLYKLIAFSLKKQSIETDDEFNKRVKFSTGLVFVALGVSQALTGLLMNRFAQKFCKFKLAIVGTLIVEVAGFVSLICFFTESFALCFVVSFLWGSSETFLQTNTGALISIIFPGRVEAFSVYRIIFSIGVICTILLSMVLSSLPAYVFLTIILGVQVLMTGISFNLSNLKNGGPGKESLLTQKEEEVES